VLEYAPIIVMAEGAVPREDTLATHEGELDAFGHARLGGIGARLEWEIEVRTGKAARATVLGYVQRGGSPTAYDRVLATRFRALRWFPWVWCHRLNVQHAAPV